MTRPMQHRIWILGIVLAFAAAAAQSAQSQTYTVIHNFAGGQDGANPQSGVTLDAEGNLDGTTSEGGDGYGTVFQLRPIGHGYTLNPLLIFARGGAVPDAAGVTIGPNSGLYGTTFYGGSAHLGTVYEVTPPASFCKSFLGYDIETVLYSFMGGTDAYGPDAGDVAFDQAGNLYGATFDGGTYGVGTVFELTESGGRWTESVLHSFGGTGDGSLPDHSVIVDRAGNLYGTTIYGGAYGNGTAVSFT